VSVGDLQQEIRRLDQEIADAEQTWASIPPGDARDRLLVEISQKRRSREARAEVIRSIRK